MLMVRCFKEAYGSGFRKSLCQLVQDQGKVPRGNESATLRSVSMENIQEMSEILSLVTLIS